MVFNRGAGHLENWATLMWWGNLYLWRVVTHLRDQLLTGELLWAAGEVLGRVGGAWCYNRWSCCRGRVHHGGRARWVVLVWPLLGHVGYWRFMTEMILMSSKSQSSRITEEREKLLRLLKDANIPLKWPQYKTGLHFHQIQISTDGKVNSLYMRKGFWNEKQF